MACISFRLRIVITLHLWNYLVWMIESIFIRIRVSPFWMIELVFSLCESSQFSPTWMIESNMARINSNQLDFHKIKSIFSTVDDRVKRGTNHLDSTSDDRVERGTNRVDFVDHRVDIIAICRRTDSIFWIDNFETNGPPYNYVHNVCHQVLESYMKFASVGD